LVSFAFFFGFFTFFSFAFDFDFFAEILQKKGSFQGGFRRNDASCGERQLQGRVFRPAATCRLLQLFGFWLRASSMPLWIATSRCTLPAMTGFGYTLPATTERVTGMSGILATRCRGVAMRRTLKLTGFGCILPQCRYGLPRRATHSSQ